MQMSVPKKDFCRFAWGAFCKNDFKEPKNFQEVGSRYADPKWEGARDMFWFFVVSKKQGFTQNACMFLGISLLSRGLHQKNGRGVVFLIVKEHCDVKWGAICVKTKI